MSFLVTADWHVGYQYSSDRRKLGDFIRFFDWMNEKANDEDAEIVVCGDVFDIRGEIPTPIFNRLMNEIERSGNDYIILTGNHDLDASQESADHTGEQDVAPHSTMAFDKLDNVESVGVTKSLDRGSTRFHVVNYEHNSDTLKGLIEGLHENTSSVTGEDKVTDVLLGHFGVAEGEIGPANIRDDSQLSVEDDVLEPFDYTFTGHYHKPQEWPQSTAVDGDNEETGEYADGGIFIPGSPIQYTFGERGQIKRVLLFEPELDEVRSVETKGPEYIVVKDDEDLDRIIESDQEMYIRFDIPVPDDAVSELRSHDRVRSAVRNYKTTDVQESRMNVSLKEVDDVGLIEDYLEYCEENELLEGKSPDRDSLAQAGKELVDEAQ